MIHVLLLLVAFLAPPSAPPNHAGDAFAACENCHSPKDWHELKTAGTSGFDHDPTGFPLRGTHAVTPCNECHQGKSIRDAHCSTCHADPHERRNGERCDQCHTTRDWRLPEALVAHQRTRLPLQGAHATTPCRDCHRGAAVDVYKGVDARCATCHSSDSKGLHPQHGAPPFTTRCDECHTAFGWRPAYVDHSKWWVLTGAHMNADCSRCHTGSRYRGTSEACVDCHRDDFARGHSGRGSTACADCHDTSKWTGAQGLTLDHDRFFPLPHKGVSECRSCHPSADRSSFTCVGCHAHPAGAEKTRHKGVRGYVFEPGACFRCHPRGT